MPPMPAKFTDVWEAFEMSGMGEYEVYVCRQSGKIYIHSEFGDEIEEVPEDIENATKYVLVPDKRALDLGTPLVLAFAGEFLADDLDEVRRIFRNKGAYARFKDLLARRNALERWYAFQAEAEQRALRAWCEDNAIALVD